MCHILAACWEQAFGTGVLTLTQGPPDFGHEVMTGQEGKGPERQPESVRWQK